MLFRAHGIAGLGHTKLVTKRPKGGFLIAVFDRFAAQREQLSEILLSRQLSPDGQRAAFCRLRRLENREFFQKLNEGRLSPCTFDLCAEAAALFCAAREVSPFPPGALRLFPCRQPLPVTADRELFRAVFLNLCCNCFLYGGKHPLLELSLFGTGSKAVLLLRDFGPGLPHSFRLPPQGGLDLAGRFAQNSGGLFLFSGAACKGVCCALSLPLQNAGTLLPPPSVNALLQNTFSPVFVQLAPLCIFPE